ncbi:hypothetical protein DPMN_061790 [Dreissena polymorpha]|uniref:Sushi domain-containing protein n=1 Tax=Dreissena polymorpha TaxID=45954 RepID=A0A9D4C7N0_DREPO|nr:hypothetical protein DPMN_061790 [Dreissena polymorpha]
MDAKKCVLGVLIWCWSVGIYMANRYAEPYSCYGDVCNEGSDAQFCDVVLGYCRTCDEVKDDCFSRLQTCNCSQFCSEHKLRQDIEKIRVGECQVPSPPEHGRYNVNTTRLPFGATLSVLCEAGYIVRNELPMRCGDFSTWTESPQTCEGSQTDWNTSALFLLGGILFMSILINIICLVQKNRGICTFKRKKDKSRAGNELQPLVDQNQIASQAETNHHTHSQMTLPSAPPIHTGIDVEGNCINDKNNSAIDLDKGHLSNTPIHSIEETNGIKSSAHASDSNWPHEFTSKYPNYQEHDTKLTPPTSLDHQNCKTNVSVVVIMETPETTNKSLKKPNGAAKQPDNLSHDVSDQTDSKYITKSMGGSIPDASTKGPVTQPVDEGFGSWGN